MYVAKSITIPAKSERSLNVGTVPISCSHYFAYSYQATSAYINATIDSFTSSGTTVYFYSLKTSNDTTLNKHHILYVGY